MDEQHRLDVHFSSGKDDWETPDDLFNTYHSLYNFILDAAANSHNHKLPRWFGPGGEAEDALTVRWPLEKGSIWLNPPYSRGLQQAFVCKAVEEVKRARQYDSNISIYLGEVVCLLPARTDTKLFHDIIQRHAKDVIFLKGRLRFKDENGIPAKAAAPFPSMIVIL